MSCFAYGAGQGGLQQSPGKSQAIFREQGAASISPATPKNAAGPAHKPSRQAHRSVPAVSVNSSDNLLF